MATTFRRKPNRLPLPNYAERHAYQLTMATFGRRKVFNEPLFKFSLEKLSFVAERRNVSVLAYCFMPDHLHLLVQAGQPSFVPAFIRDFKQATGFEFKKRTKRQLWQKSYHDHVVRTEESLMNAALYIAANPVRAGLVETPSDWPWLGSFVWERSALVEGEAIRYIQGRPVPSVGPRADVHNGMLRPSTTVRSSVRRGSCGGLSSGPCRRSSAGGRRRQRNTSGPCSWPGAL